MKKSISLFSIGLVMITSSAFGQIQIDSTDIGKSIIAVDVVGNKNTQSFVILREMKEKVGDLFYPESMMEDQMRIQNLYLFNRVEIVPVPEGEGVRLVVMVTEMWYLIPFPIFFINDRDWDKLSYGLGLIHRNFRGRAENLSFQFWLGYNPGIILEYLNPWFGGKKKLFTKISLYYDHIRSKHYVTQNVTENYHGFSWLFGKRFGYHTQFSLSVGYKAITFKPSFSGQTLSKNKWDRFPFLGAVATFDHRDLKEYPHSGWLLGIAAWQNGLPKLDVNYFEWNFDARKYFPIGSKPTLALRFRGNLNHGTVPVYAREYIGYYERVRGHFNEVSEGENRLLASGVFRFPVLPIHYFNLPKLRQLSNLKFGISMGFFIDSGLTWFQGENLSSSKIMTGYGLGLHFHLPFINVLRLELAFDEKGKHEYIIDFNVDI